MGTSPIPWSALVWTPVARTPARETLEVPSCADPDLTASSAGDTDALNLDSQESTPRPATSSHGSTLTCKFFLTLFHSFNKFSNSFLKKKKKKKKKIPRLDTTA